MNQIIRDTLQGYWLKVGDKVLAVAEQTNKEPEDVLIKHIKEGAVDPFGKYLRNAFIAGQFDTYDVEATIKMADSLTQAYRLADEETQNEDSYYNELLEDLVYQYAERLSHMDDLLTSSEDKIDDLTLNNNIYKEKYNDLIEEFIESNRVKAHY